MKTLIALILLTSSTVFAANGKPVTAARPVDRTPSQALLSDNHQWSGLNNIYGKITPYADGVGFGVNYERTVSKNIGFGGAFNFLPENDNAPSPAASLLAFTGNMYIHLPVDYVDFYVSPGLGVFMMELGPFDETAIGASLAVGTLAQLTPNVALGLEWSTFKPWFNDDSFGQAATNFSNIAVTGRLTF